MTLVAAVHYPTLCLAGGMCASQCGCSVAHTVRLRHRHCTGAAAAHKTQPSKPRRSTSAGLCASISRWRGCPTGDAMASPALWLIQPTRARVVMGTPRTARVARAAAVLSTVVAVTCWASVGAAMSPADHTALTSSVHSFVAADVGGVYSRILPTTDAGNNCPKRIDHVTLPATSDGEVTVAHSTIIMDSVRCSSVGTLELVPETEVSEGDVRSLLGDFNNDIKGSDIASLQNQIQRVLRGVETIPRTCGTRIIPTGTTVVFFSEETDITFKDLLLGREYKYLALGNAAKKLGCLYRADPARLPEVSPPALPSATPASVTPGGGTQNQNIGDPTAAPTPSPTEAKDGSEGSCFPASARVTLESGESTSVSALTVGSRVRVAADTSAVPSAVSHSDVFVFSHHLTAPHVTYTFVNITSTAGASILLTPDHYLHLYGGTVAAPSLITARSVKPGTALIAADGSRSVVASVSTAVAAGLVNPHTLSGQLIVDGFQVSSYTATLHPSLAAAALAPLRWAYRLVGGRVDVTGGLFHGGAQWVVRTGWLPRGPLRLER